MDGAFLSALAAITAAFAALIGAFSQLYIGQKQAKAASISAAAVQKSAASVGRHKLAELREQRLILLIDAIADLFGVVAILPRHDEPPQDLERANRAFAKVKLLADLKHAQSDQLFEAYTKLNASKSEKEFDYNAEVFLKFANNLISKEWSDLQSSLHIEL